MNPIIRWDLALFTLAGGNADEFYKLTFSQGPIDPNDPESENHFIPMNAFDQGVDRSTSYDLPWREQGYTLMDYVHPHHPDQNIVMVKEILEEKGILVGMLESSWRNTLQGGGFFGAWGYLDIEVNKLPALTTLEKPQPSEEDRSHFPIAASS